MKLNTRFMLTLLALSGLVAAMLVATPGALAQVTPAQGYEPVDDTPSVKVGGTIYADYTYTAEPTALDANGNPYNPASFNVSRAYINVTGNVSHLVSFRITPDITRETGSGSSLNGSYTVRLKYAFGQFNFDNSLGKGSWARLGLQQTPLVDYEENIYRYRFQGTTFADREGYLTSSDAGASFHYNFPANYGDVHVGYYNGDGYSKSEANDQKAIQARVSFRPAPTIDVMKGIRVTAFYDADNYVKNNAKTRLVGQITFEHKYVNAGFDYLKAKDQVNATADEIHGEGWSAWVTPRTKFGLEGLLRYDDLRPNETSEFHKKRGIAGVSYWLPAMKGVSSAILLDYETVKYDDPNKVNEIRYALHALVNF